MKKLPKKMAYGSKNCHIIHGQPRPRGLIVVDLNVTQLERQLAKYRQIEKNGASGI